MHAPAIESSSASTDNPSGTELGKALGKPHFSGIAQHLREAIRKGSFPLGCVLPTELDLCAHYGTSRHTVRMALQELQQQGLVSRRKNAGTRVESALPTTGFQQSLASIDDLVQFGATHTRVVQQVGEVTARAALAGLMGCAEGTRWLRISSLRMQKAAQNVAQNAVKGAQKAPPEPVKPIGLTEVYVAPGYEGLEERVRGSPDVLVSTLLEAHYGEHIQEVTQDLCAVQLHDAAANYLGVAPLSAGLRITRRYCNQAGRVVEISVTYHPAERFSMRTRLTRTGA